MERKENKAVKKEIQTANVLEFQRDAIVIVSVEDNNNFDSDPSCQNLSNDDKTALKIEFSNVKGTELFGIDLSEAMASEDNTKNTSALERLNLPQFVP